MIETSRLILCRPENNDILIIEDLWRNKDVRQFLGGIICDKLIKCKIIELQNHWNFYRFGQWVIFERITKEIIGLCGLCNSKDGIELSYMFFPKFWKKGFAREAASACIDYGFSMLNLNKIIAITQKANSESCKLLQSIGMKYLRSFKRFNATQYLFEIKCLSYSRVNSLLS